MKYKKIGIAGILTLLIVLSAFCVVAQNTDATTSNFESHKVREGMIGGGNQNEEPPMETITGEGVRWQNAEGKEFRAISAQPIFNHLKLNRVDLTIKLVNFFKDKLELTDEATIGELIENLEKIRKEQKLETIEQIKKDLDLPADTPTGEVVKEWKNNRLEQAIEELSLPEDSTPEEVLEALKAEFKSNLEENLGIEEGSSDEEIKIAIEEWKEENKPVIQAWFHKVFRWKHN